MKIVSLRAENIKRLKAVEIRPDGNLVKITGKNAQGKSSILDAIWWAMCGTRNVQAQPIRRGTDKAIVELDLGKYKVTRTFRERDEGGPVSTLRVESADGARYGSPQEVLDGLVGELSFDPLHFTRLSPALQFDALRQFVPGFDFADNAAKRKTAFDARTDFNRDSKQLRVQAAAIVVPDDLPAEPVDRQEVVAKLEAVHKENAALERRRNNLATAAFTLKAREQAIDVRRARIADLKADLATQEQELVGDEEAATKLRLAIEEFGDIPADADPGPAYEEIEKADTINRQIERRQERVDLEDRAKRKEARAAELTAEIEAIDNAKETAIAAAAMPIAGLSLGEGEVMLNGLPFNQASDAEQLRASIAIAGALNPELRVIRVRDGSLLDEDAMTALAAYATEKDLQIWIERVETGGAVGFEIEDGMVKGAAAPAVPQQAAE